jgi:hypothetical protein
MPFSIPRALVAYPACNPLIKLVAGHYASLSQREGFSSQFSTCHRYTVFGGPAGLASLHGAGFLNPRHGPWADPFFGRPTGAGASPLGRGRLPPDRPWRSGSDTLHSPRGARSFLDFEIMAGVANSPAGHALQESAWRRWLSDHPIAGPLTAPDCAKALNSFRLHQPATIRRNAAGRSALGFSFLLPVALQAIPCATAQGRRG